MEYRRLGRSGLKVSALSFGSWVTFGNQMAEDLARDCMKLAYDNGVNFFDNAEVYAAGESERIMGRVLRKMGWGRDTYSVSSKVFWGGDAPTQNGLSRKHVYDACHAALRRLQVDYLDLYFCHRPDPETPIEETVWAMNDLMRQGKVLYWGTSEWSAQQITQAHAVAKEFRLVGPAMEQPEYNLFNRRKVELDYLPLYRDFGMGTTVWSPLASGVLTGKYLDGVPQDSRFNVKGYDWLRSRYAGEDGQRRLDKVRQLKKVADGAGVSLTSLALGWCCKNPDVSTVILGASKVAQLDDNLKALGALPRLTPDVMAAVEEVMGNKPGEGEEEG